MNLKFPKIYHLAQTDYTKSDLIELSEQFSEKVDGIQLWLGKSNNSEFFIKTKNSPPLTYEICQSNLNFLKTLSLHLFLDFWDKLNEIFDLGEIYVFEYVAERNPPSVIKYDVNVPFLVLLMPEDNLSIINKLDNIFSGQILIFPKNYYDYNECLKLIYFCKSQYGVELENELGVLFRENLKSGFAAEEIEGVVIKLKNNDLIKVVPNSFNVQRTELWKKTDNITEKKRKIMNIYFKTDFFAPRKNPKILTYLQESNFKDFQSFIDWFAMEVIKENSKIIPEDLLNFINSELNSNYENLEEFVKDVYRFKLIKIWNYYAGTIK